MCSGYYKSKSYKLSIMLNRWHSNTERQVFDARHNNNRLVRAFEQLIRFLKPSSKARAKSENSCNGVLEDVVENLVRFFHTV